MGDADDRLLGLFPLGIVLLPGEVVPLHIFEERYRKLIGERLEEGEFGIVLADDDTVRECGTAARVVQLIEELDDGRMNILVQGERRFRIIEVREPADPETDYLTAEVDYYRDSEPEASPKLRDAVLTVFAKMLSLMDVEVPEEPAGEGPLSFRIAAAVDFGAPLKQELLESLSEEHRLETLLTVMTSLLPRLELRKEREEAIRGNGKGY
ncbi:MAG TPA: LON peptidase substrate-binding domain-containing protein [Thermoleophilia bacterium]|nr:LON peptidase substrate-binding domain-containing protein [Thermoleophilia bacterium]